jgi:hypothetical protein
MQTATSKVVQLGLGFILAEVYACLGTTENHTLHIVIARIYDIICFDRFSYHSTSENIICYDVHLKSSNFWPSADVKHMNTF